MKAARMLLFAALLLVSLPALAQELTQTGTLAGVTVSYPEGYSLQEAMPGAVGVLDPTESFAVIIFTGAAISSFGMPEGVTAQELVELIPTIAEVSSEIEPVTLPNGAGSRLTAEIPGIGNGVLYIIQTENGLMLGVVASQSGELPDDFLALAEAVIGSASFEAVETEPPAAEPTATPGKGSDTGVPTATPDSGTDTTDTTGIDGETCPIPVAEMPERTAVFCLGVLMSYPENWSLIDGTIELDNFASVNRENFTVSLSTTVSEISEFYNPDYYITEVLPVIAETVGHTTFDPLEHIETAIEEEGRKVEFYFPANFLESIDENGVQQVVFIVTLNNDLFVTHMFTWIPSFAGEGADFENEIEQIVMSTVLADFYDGTPAFVEIDGETVYLKTATWSDNTYLFRPNQEVSFVVVCPADGAGNEGPVWGTDVYTHDSAVCLAAVHAGVITLADGGMVRVNMLPGQDSYVGSVRNGVTTLDYGPWGESFSVEVFELP